MMPTGAALPAETCDSRALGDDEGDLDVAAVEQRAQVALLRGPVR